MKGITPYQLEILVCLSKSEKATGKLTDFDQLLSALSWAPTKESAQFTIRAVITKGFIEKADLEQRRGRNRVCYRITDAGRLILDPRVPEPSKPESAEAEFIPGLSDFDGAGFESLEG